MRKLENGAETLTVSELTEILSTYPEDMPIAATWEGLLMPITRERIYVENDELVFYVDY